MDARRIGIAAALGVVGLLVACLLVVLLCFAFAYGLVAAGIWIWAAFLIVAGTCLLLIGLAGLIAYGRIRKVTGMKMTRKSMTNHGPSTPIRIPKTSNSLIELRRRNMLQWWHSRARTSGIWHAGAQLRQRRGHQ